MEREISGEPLNPSLASKLEAMAKLDQSGRVNVQQPDWEKILEIDRTNQEQLKQIIKEHGWPKISEVGWAGAWAAWIIVQHVHDDIPFQEECLKLLESAAEEGEAELGHVAYLQDRVRVRKGLLQLYGTQWGYKDEHGSVGPYPIDNPEKLDERRAEMGMDPFSEYEKSFNTKEKE